MAGEVEWYGPEHGRGSLDDTLSHMPGVRDAVEAGARKIYHRAQLLHAAHSRTGDSSIEIEKAPSGKHLLDWYIILTDVEHSGWSVDKHGNLVGGETSRDDGTGKFAHNTKDRSAMSIEFGWLDPRTGKWHDGLHILKKAMDASIRKNI